MKMIGAVDSRAWASKIVRPLIKKNKQKIVFHEEKQMNESISIHYSNKTTHLHQ
jgi:hypothetical protein